LHFFHLASLRARLLIEEASLICKVDFSISFPRLGSHGTGTMLLAKCSLGRGMAQRGPEPSTVMVQHRSPATGTGRLPRSSQTGGNTLPPAPRAQHESGLEASLLRCLAELV